MVYRKHTQKSRKYKKSESHSEDHKPHSDQPSHIEEHASPPVEHVSPIEKKNSQPFSFLTSLFGSREKDERSGNPLINLLGYDIYLDDLLLLGLIFLIMTDKDKDKDEILIIILAYLLIDIF